MNQIATQTQAERRATPVEAFAAQVMGDETKSAELFRALPKHIPPARFQRNLLNLLMQKPEILQYDSRLVYREVSKAAALGLQLDPQLAEAYIVPVWNGKTKRKEPELRCSYKGLMKLARQSGEIANIYPGEVRDKDHFLADEGTEKRLEHQPDYRRSRGDPVCYYAVVIYKDGTKDFEVMDMDSIYEIREKSDAWRAYQDGKISSTPWVTDEGEMCKKTVLRRLLKRVPQSADLAEALALDHELSRQPANIIDISRPPEQPAPRSIEHRLDQFAAADHAPSQPTGDAADPDPAAQEADEPIPQPEASAEPAPSEAESTGVTDGAGAPEMPKKLQDAMERGRAARQSGYAREVPKVYNYKSRQDEADAFLKGWDEENIEIQAAEAGTV